MSKYVVIGGFLGAGKTTSMIGFAKYLQSQGFQPAILVNDLGAKNLVDRVTTANSGCLSAEITGDCICYQTENLVDKLRRFRDLHKTHIIFSDIPGCGIGALDHVYHKLDREYPGEFELCPFTAIADPERLRAIMPEHADLHLPTEMEFLFDAQLREAEMIILNKVDLLSSQEEQRYLDFLRRTYPQAAVFPMSARTGLGVAEAADYLMSHFSVLPTVDIGYGGPDFLAAESKLSWYNRQFHVKSQQPFDGNGLIRELMEKIRDELTAIGRNVPHLKVVANAPDWTSAKASLLGVDYPVQFDWDFCDPQTDLRIVINARAACESQVLDRLMDRSMEQTAKIYGLSLQVFFTECFGMMDEGRS